MFQSFFYRSLLNHFFQYTNKNISVKPLFNLHYLSLFQLPFTRSKFVQFTEDLAVITALTHYGSFGKHFVERRKKTVTHQPRSVRIGKNWALCLKYAATHSLAAIGSQLSTVPCLYSLQPPPPSTPFILLKKYYLRWNHLTAPRGFTLVLNIVGIISMINKAADPGELCLMFDL